MSGIKEIIHPYFILNILACFVFIISKYLKWICKKIYSAEEPCQLEWRDQEILIFLCFVIVIKNRKWKPTQWREYISNVFMFTKGANMLLFLRKDVRLGIVYMIFCFVLFIIVPEPKYKGPEDITYFRGQALEEEILRNPKIVYVIEFFALWSSPCTHFAQAFAEISLAYGNDYLKFGKVDIGRYPLVAEKYNIDTSVTSKQLPTIILFVNGQEKIRKPVVDKKGTVWKYTFTKENMIKDFNLNEYLEESKKKSKCKNINEDKSLNTDKSKTD